MATIDENLAYLKDSERYPKVNKRNVTDAKSQFSGIEYNKLVGAVEDIYSSIKASGMTLSFSGGGYVFYGDSGNFTLVARTNIQVDSIVISSGTNTLASVENGSSVSYSAQGISSATSFKATAKIGTSTKESTQSVSVVYPSWVGSGDSYESITTDGARKTTSKGTNTVQVLQGKRVYIVTPETITAKYNGFDFPMTKTTITKYGKTYNVYTSDELIAGSYTITVS